MEQQESMENHAIEPVRWGVLGTASIAVNKVIPAMQASALCEVVAIASRDGARAREAADDLGIRTAHGSYEALLSDPSIEAVYIPLPNHLHVPWSIRAAEAGKHVLCEKPIGLDAADARRLLEARDRSGVTIAEAFMVRTHPQWIGVRERVRRGDLGDLRLVACHFSYFKDDPADIRSRREWGGGGLLDIGCYAVHIARWLFDAEPRRVVALVDRDARLDVDILASAILDFGQGRATFTCGTRMVPYQRVQVLGTRGRVEVEIPFNTPPDRSCRIRLDDGRDPVGTGVREMGFDVIDQFTTQGDAVSRAIRGIGPVPVPLEDSVANMATLDALFRSEVSADWEVPEP
jgi:predicted dehydrogenase